VLRNTSWSSSSCRRRNRPASIAYDGPDRRCRRRVHVRGRQAWSWSGLARNAKRAGRGGVDRPRDAAQLQRLYPVGGEHEIERSSVTSRCRGTSLRRHVQCAPRSASPIDSARASCSSTRAGTPDHRRSRARTSCASRSAASQLQLRKIPALRGDLARGWGSGALAGDATERSRQRARCRGSASCRDLSSRAAGGLSIAGRRRQEVATRPATSRGCAERCAGVSGSPQRGSRAVPWRTSRSRACL